VLSLDADEWVSPELAGDIRKAIGSAGPCAAYALSRLSSYCGRYIRHSGWRPDWVPRLFRRGRARFSDDLVHERLLVDGQVGRLRGELLHEAFVDLDEVLQKVNNYSTWGAQKLQQQGARGGLTKAVTRGAWSFIRSYVLRGGFLDGREGFMLAVSIAEGTYYKFLKLAHSERTRRR
jgi:hypothetical protein